jgi:hypothetical protein
VLKKTCFGILSMSFLTQRHRVFIEDTEKAAYGKPLCYVTKNGG